MGSIKKIMLGAALAVGAVGLAATPANAAVRFGVAIGGPAAYVPPSPGPGYVWVNGYWADGYWVPGYWNFVGDSGYGYGYDSGPYYGGYYYGGRGEHFRDRDDYYRDRDDHYRDNDDYRGDRYRGEDHRGGDHYRGGDRDHDRHDRR